MRCTTTVLKNTPELRKINILYVFKTLNTSRRLNLLTVMETFQHFISGNGVNMQWLRLPALAIAHRWLRVRS